MKTLARSPRWTSRLGVALLAMALFAVTVIGYQAALDRTGRAVHAVLSSNGSRPCPPALAASPSEPPARN